MLTETVHQPQFKSRSVGHSVTRMHHHTFHWLLDSSRFNATQHWDASIQMKDKPVTNDLKHKFVFFFNSCSKKNTDPKLSKIRILLLTIFQSKYFVQSLSCIDLFCGNTIAIQSGSAAATCSTVFIGCLCCALSHRTLHTMGLLGPFCLLWLE